MLREVDVDNEEEDEEDDEDDEDDEVEELVWEVGVEELEDEMLVEVDAIEELDVVEGARVIVVVLVTDCPSLLDTVIETEVGIA